MRFWKSKKNALISSVIFISFYAVFQFWNYYTIVNKTSVKLDVRVEEEIFKFDAPVETPSPGAAPGHGAPQDPGAAGSFWLHVEQNVNMNYRRDFDYFPHLVHPMFAHLYLPDHEGMFVCYGSGQRIHHTKINDDYCDCPDGSDEPSTPACQNGRFYCKFQTIVHDLMWIRSNLVADGVCDCPDGSDEPKPFKVPSLEPSAAEKETRCRDTTDDMLEKERALRRLNAVGAEVKDAWIAEVAGDAEVLGSKLYGHRGEFHKVGSSPCQTVQRGKYSYEVCPFGRSVQRAHNVEIVIGRSPSWLKYNDDEDVAFKHKNSRRDDNFVLMSEGGDATNCPDKSSRKTFIKFTCDVQNRIMEVSEKETCKYEVDYGTPAACHYPHGLP